MSEDIFLLDANIFIQAARTYYAFDFAPGFWAKLVALGNERKIESIDKVRDELIKGNDELKEWAVAEFSNAFYSTDDAKLFSIYGDIIGWVNEQKYKEAAKADFAKGADGWLIAFAKVYGRVLVTQEAYDPKILRKVPIPNVCRTFKVETIETFEMNRRLEIKWNF
jgi:hypothetical protein